MRLRTIVVLAMIGMAVLPLEAQCKPETLDGDSQWQWRRLCMFYKQNKNYSAALTCFRVSAQQGNFNSQERLGDMYFEGKGVPQNFALAFQWYKRAAMQPDHPPSCGTAGQVRTKVAQMYEEGQGVRKDEIEAYKWYVLADRLYEARRVTQQMTVGQVAEAQRRLDLWNVEHPQVSTCD